MHPKMNPMTREFSWKKALSWSFYDFANSAFATTVMAGFFPLFFKQYWSAGADVTVSTFKLGAANSAASLLVLLAAPFLGAVADQGAVKKPLLLVFILLGITCTGGLYLVGKGDWVPAVTLYVTASVGFFGGNVFYDSLLVTVTGGRRLDFVSALGYALGYLGGGMLFTLNTVMVLAPGFFGLGDASTAVRVSFLTVGAWGRLFSLPLFFNVPEPAILERTRLKEAVSAGLSQLAGTFREARKHRTVFLFLAAYWLYIDGVYTIIKMAVDYGLSLGLGSTHLILALLITQFVGFPAAVVYGRLGEKYGARKGIFFGIAAYLAITVWGYFISSEREFYALAVAVGLVQGGIQSLSRSFYARIIPPDKTAEFFGFYGLVGKASAVLGPVLMGWAAMASGNPRTGIFMITLLLLAGGGVLTRVKETKT
jgi:UMF1 family MFS transporter